MPLSLPAWGPFSAGLDPAERKARLRCLRFAIKLLAGPQGQDASVAVLRAEVSDGDAELLDAASLAFDRLPPLVRRRVLSSMVDVCSN